MIGNFTAEDGCLCERCGDMATHFHEDFGMMCQACAARASNHEPPPDLVEPPAWRECSDYDFYAFGGGEHDAEDAGFILVSEDEMARQLGQRRLDYLNGSELPF